MVLVSRMGFGESVALVEGGEERPDVVDEANAFMFASRQVGVAVAQD